jgi:hypothetical protein
MAIQLDALAGGIVARVQDAAARTGVDFSYLLAQAKLESGLDPSARAATSSARGLFQFTSATWLETVRKHGSSHGLGWAADALASGAAQAGSAARAAILSLRDNAEAASLMAGELARDNAAVLEARLGRAAGATDLYMAHFLGAGGATHFLRALAATPDDAAAAVAPAAAAANRGVFFDTSGRARSVGEVYARFAAKLAPDGVGGSSRVDSAKAASPRGSPRAMDSRFRGGDGHHADAASVSAAPRLDTRRAAQTAYALLAELGG